jgi:hypothetical protein
VLAAANRFCKQFVHRSPPVGRCFSIDFVTDSHQQQFKAFDELRDTCTAAMFTCDEARTLKSFGVTYMRAGLSMQVKHATEPELIAELTEDMANILEKMRALLACCIEASFDRHDTIEGAMREVHAVLGAGADDVEKLLTALRQVSSTTTFTKFGDLPDLEHGAAAPTRPSNWPLRNGNGYLWAEAVKLGDAASTFLQRGDKALVDALRVVEVARNLRAGFGDNTGKNIDALFVGGVAVHAAQSHARFCRLVKDRMSSFGVLDLALCSAAAKMVAAAALGLDVNAARRLFRWTDAQLEHLWLFDTVGVAVQDKSTLRPLLQAMRLASLAHLAFFEGEKVRMSAEALRALDIDGLADAVAAGKLMPTSVCLTVLLGHKVSSDQIDYLERNKPSAEPTTSAAPQQRSLFAKGRETANVSRQFVADCLREFKEGESPAKFELPQVHGQAFDDLVQLLQQVDEVRARVGAVSLAAAPFVPPVAKKSDADDAAGDVDEKSPTVAAMSTLLPLSCLIWATARTWWRRPAALIDSIGVDVFPSRALELKAFGVVPESKTFDPMLMLYGSTFAARFAGHGKCDSATAIESIFGVPLVHIRSDLVHSELENDEDSANGGGVEVRRGERRLCLTLPSHVTTSTSEAQFGFIVLAPAHELIFKLLRAHLMQEYKVTAETLPSDDTDAYSKQFDVKADANVLDVEDPNQPTWYPARPDAKADEAAVRKFAHDVYNAREHNTKVLADCAIDGKEQLFIAMDVNTTNKAFGAAGVQVQTGIQLDSRKQEVGKHRVARGLISQDTVRSARKADAAELRGKMYEALVVNPSAWSELYGVKLSESTVSACPQVHINPCGSKSQEEEVARADTREFGMLYADDDAGRVSFDVLHIPRQNDSKQHTPKQGERDERVAEVRRQFVAAASAARRRSTSLSAAASALEAQEQENVDDNDSDAGADDLHARKKARVSAAAAAADDDADDEDDDDDDDADDKQPQKRARVEQQSMAAAAAVADDDDDDDADDDADDKVPLRHKVRAKRPVTGLEAHRVRAEATLRAAVAMSAAVAAAQPTVGAAVCVCRCDCLRKYDCDDHATDVGKPAPFAVAAAAAAPLPAPVKHTLDMLDTTPAPRQLFESEEVEWTRAQLQVRLAELAAYVEFRDTEAVTEEGRKRALSAGRYIVLLLDCGVAGDRVGPTDKWIATLALLGVVVYVFDARRLHLGGPSIPEELQYLYKGPRGHEVLFCCPISGGSAAALKSAAAKLDEPKLLDKVNAAAMVEADVARHILTEHTNEEARKLIRKAPVVVVGGGSAQNVVFGERPAKGANVILGRVGKASKLSALFAGADNDKPIFCSVPHPHPSAAAKRGWCHSIEQLVQQTSSSMACIATALHMAGVDGVFDPLLCAPRVDVALRGTYAFQAPKQLTVADLQRLQHSQFEPSERAADKVFMRVYERAAHARTVNEILHDAVTVAIGGNATQQADRQGGRRRRRRRSRRSRAAAAAAAS